MRAPVYKDTNSDDVVKHVGIILRTMAHSHRICDEFIAHFWRDHPVMSETITFYLFHSMVPVSLFRKLKEEILLVTKIKTYLKVDGSKCATQ